MQKGNIYKLKSDANWFAVYDSIGFSKNIPEIGGYYDESILAAAPPVAKKFYVPSEDGYILLSYPVGARTYIYEIDYSVSNAALPLKDKTIAVLGDSIMEFMGGVVPESNVITLKNITDPTDQNVYYDTDATIVDGIVYLTSSLVGGEVVPGSIRLELVNSEQGYIDSRGWDLLRKQTGASAVINCGQGGGTYPEMGVVTKYPSTTLSGFFGDKTQSFPNQVKMLKRLVDEGRYFAPDCIVIWMGINGTTLLVNDTLEEAMAIDWDVLSDDVAGYAERTKYFAAIRYGIEYLYRSFPYATIVILSPIMTNRGDKNITGEWDAYRGYGNIKSISASIRSIAERYSCLFFDALTQIGLANFAYKADTTLPSGEQIATGDALGNLIPLYLQDGVHPNSAGKVVLANYLSRILNSFYFSKR